MTAAPARKIVEGEDNGFETLALDLSMARGLDEVMAVIRHRARALIVAERGRHFDSALVDVFAEIAGDFAAIHKKYTDAV